MLNLGIKESSDRASLEGAEALCNANRATVCGQQISLDHEPASP